MPRTHYKPSHWWLTSTLHMLGAGGLQMLQVFKWEYRSKLCPHCLGSTAHHSLSLFFFFFPWTPSKTSFCLKYFISLMYHSDIYRDLSLLFQINKFKWEMSIFSLLFIGRETFLQHTKSWLKSAISSSLSSSSRHWKYPFLYYHLP